MSQVEPSIDPAPFIAANVVLSSIGKIKLGKPPDPLNVIAETLKSSPDQCSQLIADLINAIFKEGKDSALDRGNYHGLKLTDQVQKVVERVIEKSSGNV